MPGRTSSHQAFFYTYVLESKTDGAKYIGYTNDLRERLELHNKGLVRSTVSRRPLSLIYFEACVSRTDAKRREVYLKTTGGRRFLAKRLKSYLATRNVNLS